jgi:putative MATE family efflux protein
MLMEEDMETNKKESEEARVANPQEVRAEEANPLGVRPINQLIAQFAIPAIISMLVSSLYNIVDQIFIGQGVGMLGNAATNVAFPLTSIATAVALLLGIGTASNYNLEMGAKRKKRASEIAGTGLASLFLFGVAIAMVVWIFLEPMLDLFGATPEVFPYALDYTGITALGLPCFVLTVGGNHIIRADRNPTYSMICMLTGAILNTILDPIFIFGFGWGIQGAAAATVIGQLSSALLVVLYFWKFRNMDLKREHFKPTRRNLLVIASLGMASCINQIALVFVQILLNNTLRYYGGQSIYGSDIPLACVGIISKINSVFLAICIGISQGCQPIWGFNYGAKNYNRVRETYLKAAALCTTIATIAFLAFQIFPRQIVSIFGTGSEEYFRFAVRYLKIYLFMTFLNGIQPMSSGFFTSIGKAKLGIVMSLTRQVIFLIPLIILLPYWMGIDGLMYAGPIADGAAAVLAITFATRQLRWMQREEKKLQESSVQSNNLSS